jgi:hypothetical protein
VAVTGAIATSTCGPDTTTGTTASACGTSDTTGWSACSGIPPIK